MIHSKPDLTKKILDGGFFLNININMMTLYVDLSL